MTATVVVLHDRMSVYAQVRNYQFKKGGHFLVMEKQKGYKVWVRESGKSGQEVGTFSYDRGPRCRKKPLQWSNCLGFDT